MHFTRRRCNTAFCNCPLYAHPTGWQFLVYASTLARRSGEARSDRPPGPRVHLRQEAVTPQLDGVSLCPFRADRSEVAEEERVVAA